MNTKPTYQLVRRVFLASLLAGLGTFPGYAQFTFNSGSNGSDGPMDITANTTLDMPADGIFHCTTITVATGATLKFTPNSLNTPVYLLATGDVTISGTIDLSGVQGSTLLGGAGGPGGFAGGNPPTGDMPPGDGHGPGAGRAGSQAGAAGYGEAGSNYVGTPNNGVSYGSPLLVPLVGGSGGGGMTNGTGGAGGGGAILVASNTRIDVQGGISSSSYSCVVQPDHTYGFGSGGAVRLVSPVVGGVGTLNVFGGRDTAHVPRGGGRGRIRIDCLDKRFLATLTCTPAAATSIGAMMMTFPPTPPRLDITQVAGNAVGTGAPVFFMLPVGSPTNQNVTVQATNFGAVVPIRVVLTPDNGSALVYDAEINNSAAGSASVNVEVDVPVNVQVHVEAWTQ
jgi:hypothetical protein